jgi:hemerythrin superfamily protein
MTDAVTLLTSDHRMVEELFSEVEGRPDPDPGVVHQIVRAGSGHDAVEKEFLYPTVRQRLETGGELADHGTTEHDEVARTLVAVDKAEAGSDELTTALHTLIGLVRTHVGEEESQIFPALRTAMSTAELADLGETLATAKQSAPTRPHPLAPSGALGAMVAGALSAPLDKVRDIVEGRP